LKGGPLAVDDLMFKANTDGNDAGNAEVVYNAEKDFYKGMKGELRYKAEGLFKKAREKGISIEDIEVIKLNDNSADFPGLGQINLPTLLVKIRGKHMQSGQVIADGKQIDFYNRYQQYIAERIQKKSSVKDDKDWTAREGKRTVMEENSDYSLSDWELFEIGKDLLDDKEFGLEKTITGACDRVIRKLMGENDWLSPGEARLLDEEFADVQRRAEASQEKSRGTKTAVPKRATERQINYLKARIKNMGEDPYDNAVIREVIRQSGFDAEDINSLSMGEVSKIIDSINIIMPKVKKSLSERNRTGAFESDNGTGSAANIRQ